jgi:glycosyltransferase involved in cell wall biosynthesis
MVPIKRVCLLVLELPIGGLEKGVINLANGLMSHNINVRVIILENDDNTLIKDLRKDIDLRCLEYPLIIKLFFLRRLCKDSIIHLHFWGGHVRPLYRLAIFGLKPIISTYHNDYTFMRGEFWTKVDKFLSFQLDKMVAVSNTVKKYCTEVVGIPESKVKIIYNGVENLRGNNKIHIYHKTQITSIVTIARLIEQKNIITLIRGLNFIIHKGYKVHLYIVGDGPELNYLQQYVANEGLDNFITWYGEIINKKRIGKILQSSDLFISTSLWEGFPNSILEAMAEGLPIIASNIPPHHEALGDSGIYFSTKDFQELGKNIIALLENRKQMEIMGRKNYMKARIFTIERYIEEHIMLYQKLSKI